MDLSVGILIVSCDKPTFGFVEIFRYNVANIKRQFSPQIGTVIHKKSVQGNIIVSFGS